MPGNEYQPSCTVTGIAPDFNFIEWSISIVPDGSDFKTGRVKYFATPKVIGGILRLTDLSQLTRFSLTVEGSIVTGFKKISDVSRAEYARANEMGKQGQDLAVWMRTNVPPRKVLSDNGTTFPGGAR